MKKQIYFLVSLLALIGFSMNVSAQSTGANPYQGATHHYSVTPESGHNYVWKVYEYVSNAKTEINTFDGTKGISAFTQAGTGNSDVEVKWATTASPGKKYLLEVTDWAGPIENSCQNTKGYVVTITATNFYLTASTTNGCYANAVTVGWTGTDNVTYDHGTANVNYTIKVTGVGTNEDWKFKPTFNAGDVKITSGDPTVKQGTKTLPRNADGTYTANGTADVSIDVIYTNANSYDNSSAANAQDFTGTITLSDISSGTGAIEKSGAGTNSIGSKVSRPSTSQISPN